IPLARLSPSAIQNLYVTLLESGLSGSTVRRAAAVLHTALRDAVRRGLIIRNPQENTTLPRRNHYEPTVPTPEQVIAYLEDARETATPSVWALYVTAAASGLREGELLGLREDAIDLERRVLSVRQQLVRAGRQLIFGQPKTAKGRRTVLLPAVAVDALRTAGRWKREQRLRLGPRFRDSGLIFCGPSGAPIHVSNLYRRDHLPRLARLGLPHFRIHDFRHFHGTYLHAEGVDARTGADRLGHADPGFFTRTYTHAVVAAQERAATIANELLTKTARSSG
ncbi:MAG TPA: site-specific integrase, partial [bacterium]|nr:site-specific integrase [bacterium]